MRNKVTTGIPGLDDMLYGGIPDGNQVVIVGGPGAGKTLSCFEFIYKNALLGHNGVYISFEEKDNILTSNVKEAFSDFTDIDKLIAEKKITVVGEDINSYATGKAVSGEPMYAFSRVIAEIVSLVSSTGAKRVVIDSLSVFRALIQEKLAYRSLSISLVSILRSMGVTSMLTSELAEYDPNKLKFPPEFFLYDGLVMMHSAVGTEKTRPSIEVLKMRGTNHSHARIPYMIESSGVSLLTLGNIGGD